MDRDATTVSGAGRASDIHRNDKSQRHRPEVRLFQTSGVCGGRLEQPTQTPERIFRGFFVFLPNTFDFPVKIVDTPYTRVTTMSDKQTMKGETMKITITEISPTGKDVLKDTFDNSIDANEWRDKLDAEGIDYRVEWECK